MSGQQIGMVVGGFVGFFAGGNVSLGMSIGGAIGGALDPQHIRGPSIGDAQEQTSLAGMPIPAFFGRCPPVAPTLVDGDKVARKILVEEQQGKGGGPVVESERWIATRFFMVGESPGGSANIARIRRNGKLVYSAIAGDALDADSAAFAQQITIYRGGPAQGPDPSLEAIHGVGQTHYYLDKLCFIVRDDDETQMGGRPNVYSVEVASGAASMSSGAYTAKTFSNNTPWHPNAPNRRDPRKSDTTYQYAYVDTPKAYDDATVVWRDTVAEAIADAEADGGYHMIGTGEPELMGWSTYFSGADGLGGTTPMAPWADITGESWSDRYVLGLAYSRYPANSTAAIVTQPDACGNFPEPVWAAQIKTEAGVSLHVNATIQNLSEGPAGYDTQDFCDDGSGPLVLKYNIYTGFNIACRPVPTCGAALVPYDAVEIPDAPGFYAGTDHEVYGGNTYTSVAGTFKQLSLLAHDNDPADTAVGAQITSLPLAPVLSSTDANYSNQAYWDAQAAIAKAAGTLDAAATYSAAGTGGLGTYPRAISSACQITPPIPLIDPDAAVWQDIVNEIAARADPRLPSHLDIAHMTDAVPGFVLGNASLSGTDYTRALCRWYFTNLSDRGDAIYAVRSGGPTVGALLEADMVKVEKEDDDVRPLDISAARRLNVMYPDPANNYVVTPQSAARTSPDVVSSGVLTIQCPIPFDSTTMAQKADILQKVEYARLEGTFTRSFKANYTKFITGEPVVFKGRRHVIDKTINSDSMVAITGTYDRASAFSSAAIGTTGAAPAPQTSNLKGPVVFFAANLPSLRSTDNQPGIYVGARGLLPGYPGCDLLVSFDGGITWPTTLRMARRATLGLVVDKFNAGDPLLLVDMMGSVLDSVTSEQIAAGGNAFTVVTAGVAEILQAQTATEDIDQHFELTDITPARRGTLAADHFPGDRVALLNDNLYFLPIDAGFGGQVIHLWPVTLGTAPANNAKYTLTFDPPTFVYTGGDSTT